MTVHSFANTLFKQMINSDRRWRSKRRRKMMRRPSKLIRHCRYTVPVYVAAMFSAVTGLKVHENKVYIARETSSLLEIYMLNNIELNQYMKIKIRPSHHKPRQYLQTHLVKLASCSVEKCIYDCDRTNSCVRRLGPPDEYAICRPWQVSNERN